MEEQSMDTRERELLKNYVDARQKEELLRAETTAAYKGMEAAKNQLVEYLQDMNKKSTGNYADLGSVLITEPIASVSVPEEKRADQFIFLKEIGAAAVIKETVHHATFASLIRERLENGEPIPEFVKIAYVPQVKYSKPKTKD